MTTLTALYFTVETISTVGYGDFSFADQSTAMEVFGILLIAGGATLLTTVFALITNVLVSWRIEQSLGRQQLVGLEGHVVVIGLGSVGIRVLEGLQPRAGRWWWWSAARTTASSTRPGPWAPPCSSPTPPSARPSRTPTCTRRRRWPCSPATTSPTSRPAWPSATISGSGGATCRWCCGSSTASWATPSSTTSTSGTCAPPRPSPPPGSSAPPSGSTSSAPSTSAEQAFLVGRLTVAPGRGLDGLAMVDLPAQTRVIALSRAADGGRLEHPPRRDTRFAPGDQAYVLGPLRGAPPGAAPPARGGRRPGDHLSSTSAWRYARWPFHPCGAGPIGQFIPKPRSVRAEFTAGLPNVHFRSVRSLRGVRCALTSSTRVERQPSASNSRRLGHQWTQT